MKLYILQKAYRGFIVLHHAVRFPTRRAELNHTILTAFNNNIFIILVHFPVYAVENSDIAQSFLLAGPIPCLETYHFRPIPRGDSNVCFRKNRTEPCQNDSQIFVMVSYPIHLFNAFKFFCQFQPPKIGGPGRL